MAITLKPASLNPYNVGINDLHETLNNVIKNKQYSNNSSTKQIKDDNIDYSTTYGDNLEDIQSVEELEYDLQSYYYGCINVYNYKNLLYNITIPVYKNLPYPLDWDSLTTIYYDCNNEYFIKKNKLIYDIRPLWDIFRNTYNL